VFTFMCELMLVRVGMSVLMLLAVMMAGVGRVIVRVLMSRLGDVAVIEHVNFRSRDAAAVHLLNAQRRADIEGAHGLFKHGRGNARIEQGTQKHVAGSTGKAFEISETHGTPFTVPAHRECF